MIIKHNEPHYEGLRWVCSGVATSEHPNRHYSLTYVKIEPTQVTSLDGDKLRRMKAELPVDPGFYCVKKNNQREIALEKSSTETSWPLMQYMEPDASRGFVAETRDRPCVEASILAGLGKHDLCIEPRHLDNLPTVNVWVVSWDPDYKGSQRILLEGFPGGVVEYSSVICTVKHEPFDYFNK